MVLSSDNLLTARFILFQEQISIKTDDINNFITFPTLLTKLAN